MRVAITGSTGLVGSALIDKLLAEGHEPIRIVRSTVPDELAHVRWNPAAGFIESAELIDVDAVVHLAGESIGERRWSESQKEKLVRSRIDGTSLMSSTLASLANPPSVFISASAIGAYGSRGDEILTEASSRGNDFLAGLCRDWEAAADSAREAGIRVVHPRSGIVLARRGGALGNLLPFFKMGVGGRIGDGSQWMSWISIHDHVAALMWLLAHEVSGPVNFVAPTPVTNREFTKVLGRVLRRPTALPTPKPALWARLGRELTEALLYSSARVHPEVLIDAGFRFVHTSLDEALRAVLSR